MIVVLAGASPVSPLRTFHIHGAVRLLGGTAFTPTPPPPSLTKTALLQSLGSSEWTSQSHGTHDQGRRISGESRHSGLLNSQRKYVGSDFSMCRLGTLA